MDSRLEKSSFLLDKHCTWRRPWDKKNEMLGMTPIKMLKRYRETLLLRFYKFSLSPRYIHSRRTYGDDFCTFQSSLRRQRIFSFAEEIADHGDLDEYNTHHWAIGAIEIFVSYGFVVSYLSLFYNLNSVAFSSLYRALVTERENCFPHAHFPSFKAVYT